MNVSELSTPQSHDILLVATTMASVGTLGRVEEFDGDKQNWQQYVERLGHFFLANGITDAAKQQAVFLSVNVKVTNTRSLQQTWLSVWLRIHNFYHATVYASTTSSYNSLIVCCNRDTIRMDTNC